MWYNKSNIPLLREFFLYMDLIGQQVLHSKFGKGKIIGQEDDYISVHFNDPKSPRKFLYPSCFKSFLKLLNDEAANEIVEIIERCEEEEKEKKIQEEQRIARQYSVQRAQKYNKSSQKQVKISPFDSVEMFCEKYKQEIDAEIVYLRTNGGKKQRVFDGKRIESKNGKNIYTFESEDELTFPEGTQIVIWIGKASVLGSIIGCEDFIIVIATNTNLGDKIPLIEFSAEPWRLLQALNERLDEIAKNVPEIVRSLVCDGYKYIDNNNYKITTGQENAIQMSQQQPISFIWGPPGTGKTQTLAQIALEHIRKGQRVLMLSYSNVSVDGAIMRVYDLSRKNVPGRLIRYGYPRQKELLAHDYLTSYNLAILMHPVLMHERKSLIEERKSVSKNSERYVQITQRLGEIRKILSSEEKELVKKAKFVATTVSKAIVDSTIRSSQFDVVIFDEASMAYIPQIVFSASLSKKYFICMGDFKQLPPIVQNSGESLLNADIFQYCGIATAVDKGKNHEWLCMLNVQYRMHPHISDFASKTMYNGLLYSADGMKKNRENIVNTSPVSGHALTFADLSGMMSVCTKTAGNSRINVLSALLSFSLALEASGKYEVGIITPYHAQSRLLHAMSRDVSKSHPELKQISCATVHQFQGSEKDIIVYDAVDCYRMQHPGMLLTSTSNNYANRLFNVAITRAKGKFIGVANIDYMENKNLSNGLMFRKMIEEQKQKTSCLTGQDLLQHRSLTNSGIMRFFNKVDGNQFFLKEIYEAKNEIRIDIPNEPLDDSLARSLSIALQKAKSKGLKVYLRVEDKTNTPSSLKPFAIENAFIVNPIVLIDKKIVWFGIPNSNTNFKSEGKTIQTKYRPIIRFEGKHTAMTLYGFMEMNRTVDQPKEIVMNSEGTPITETFATYVLAKKKCPICGKPMKLQKSKKGKFFLACTGYPTCQHTELPDVDFIERYFYRHGGAGQRCPQCNCSLEAKLGPYGVYIQCCGYPPHRYKLDQV